MSYVTLYNLDVTCGDDGDWMEIISRIRAGSDDARLAIEADGGPDNEVAWDDHEEEIAEVSKSFPDAVLSLYGEGQDGDLWVKHFQDGRVQRGWAEIVYAEFDSSKLVEVAMGEG